ncbi:MULTISPECIES: TorF family putative porin [unclassified Variovorax]|uniref:TorF family putative porin n=1 Tax=unclassified Variovorax TaxID=663243 RepID=UPI001BD5DE9F|nr:MULTISPECIES: TorF family putative porin [unclassified Variovorax]
MMHRNTATALVALATTLATSGAAFAQSTPAADPAAATPAPVVSPLTANVSFTTNYKFRGQDQDMISNSFTSPVKTSGFKPAIQGGFDYAHESGFYVGNWNSSVNWLPGNSIESDFYGGYKFKAGPVDLDFGVLQYYYSGNTAGNTTELYGAGTWADEVLGSFTAKYSWTVSKDYFNYAGNKAGSGQKGQNTSYLNLSYSKTVLTSLTLKAAVGYTFMSSDIKSLGYRNYLDYNVGASWDFGGGLSLAGSVQGANHEDAYAVANHPGFDLGFGPIGATTYSPNKARFIATLTKTF